MIARFLPLIVFLLIIGAGVYALFRFKNEITILREFFEFLREKKLWWIAPIVIILILLGVMIFAFETGAISSMLYVLF